MSSRQGVLLTGATGFLGQYVLRDLILQSHPVTVLIRDSRSDRAAERIARVIAFWAEQLAQAANPGRRKRRPRPGSPWFDSRRQARGWACTARPLSTQRPTCPFAPRRKANRGGPTLKGREPCWPCAGTSGCRNGTMSPRHSPAAGGRDHHRRRRRRGSRHSTIPTRKASGKRGAWSGHARHSCDHLSAQCHRRRQPDWAHYQLQRSVQLPGAGRPPGLS